MKKLMAGGAAALALTTGSLGAAALLPFGAASAQTDNGGSTTTTPAPPQRGGHLDEALTSLVSDGTLTQAQADAIKAKLDALHASGPQGPRGERGERGMPGKGGPMAGANPEDIASALGITTDQLRTQLESGASLRSIAGDKVAALTTLLTEKANARIDEQLKAGKIDQAKADELKAGVAAKIQEMLDRTGPPQGQQGPKGPMGGHGPRGPQGMTPPSGQAPSGTTTPSSTTGGA